MSLSSDHVGELAEHELICAEQLALAPKPWPTLLAVGATHRDEVRVFQLHSNDYVMCYLSCGFERNYRTRPASSLRRGDVLISHDKVWTVTDVLETADAPTMPQDHNGPEDGKCFLSLNLTDEQMAPVQEAIASNFPGCDVEESVAKICREWLEHKDLIDAQPQLLKCFWELLDFAEGTAGDNRGRPWDWIEKAKAVVSSAEGNT